jgi:hypothetical protein
MKLKIIQYYTPNLTYAPTSEKINRDYCEKHDIDYFAETSAEIISNTTNRRALQWYKILFLQEQLRNSDHDYVIYLDADAVVVKPEKDIRDIINEYLDSELIIARDFGPDLVNTGVMIFKNTPWSIDFLERVWHAGDHVARGKFKVEIWHEQTIMSAFTHINKEDAKKISILDPGSHDSINDHILRNGITFIYHDLSKIRIQEISKINSGEYDVETELNLACESDRHVSYRYGTYYVDKIKEILQTKETVSILDIGGDKSIIFSIILKYFPQLSYYNFTDCEYDIDNERVNKIIIYPITEENLDAFLESNKDSYDIVIADFLHRCMYRDLLFSKFFNRVNPGGVFVVEDLQTDREITNPEKNAQYDWGDPEKKSMKQLIEGFNIDGTFNSDYYNFKDSSESISKAEIIESKSGALLGLIYKK